MKSQQVHKLYQYVIRSLVLSVFLLLFSYPAFAQDTASVKIKVDISDVLLTINADTITEDSHGNSLTKEAWFILNLTVGNYEIVFAHPDYEAQHKSVTLTPNQIVTLDIFFLPQTAPAGPITGAVTVVSEPDGAAILIDGVAIDAVTPAELDVEVGERMIEVIVADFEPISRAISVDSMHRTIMTYKLRPLPPPELTTDSLGLMYDIELPKLDEQKAELLRRNFNALAETFAIIPLSQGFMAKALLDSDDQGTANALVISGIVLTAGSYILGRVLSKRRLQNIKLRNLEIEEYNAQASAHNFDIDQMVREANKAAYKKYLSDNKGRGRVRVTAE